jgi:hypothetical protein
VGSAFEGHIATAAKRVRQRTVRTPHFAPPSRLPKKTNSIIFKLESTSGAAYSVAI